MNSMQYAHTRKMLVAFIFLFYNSSIILLDFFLLINSLTAQKKKMYQGKVYEKMYYPYPADFGLNFYIHRNFVFPLCQISVCLLMYW